MLAFANCFLAHSVTEGGDDEGDLAFTGFWFSMSLLPSVVTLSQSPTFHNFIIIYFFLTLLLRLANVAIKWGQNFGNW